MINDFIDRERDPEENSDMEEDGKRERRGGGGRSIIHASIVYRYLITN